MLHPKTQKALSEKIAYAVSLSAMGFVVMVALNVIGEAKKPGEYLVEARLETPR